MKTEARMDCPRCGKTLSPFRVWQMRGHNWRFECHGCSPIDAFFRMFCRWKSGIIGEEYHPKDAIGVNLDGIVEFRKKLTREEINHERCIPRYSDRQA